MHISDKPEGYDPTSGAQHLNSLLIGVTLQGHVVNFDNLVIHHDHSTPVRSTALCDRFDKDTRELLALASISSDSDAEALGVLHQLHFHRLHLRHVSPWWGSWGRSGQRCCVLTTCPNQIWSRMEVRQSSQDLLLVRSRCGGSGRQGEMSLKLFLVSQHTGWQDRSQTLHRTWVRRINRPCNHQANAGATATQD